MISGIYYSISVCTIFHTILHTFTCCSLSIQHWQLPSSMGHFQLWVYMRLWSHSKCLHQMPDWMLEDTDLNLLEIFYISPVSCNKVTFLITLYFDYYSSLSTYLFCIEALWIYLVYFSLLCSSGTSVLHYSKTLQVKAWEWSIVNNCRGNLKILSSHTILILSTIVEKSCCMHPVGLIPIIGLGWIEKDWLQCECFIPSGVTHWLSS